MDIVGGAYGGPDPHSPDPHNELRRTLETAKSWLEGALSHWEELSEENRLEMLAASLLSMNRLDMQFDGQISAVKRATSGLRSQPGVPERPNLVDLSLEEGTGKATARVQLQFQNRALVGESLFREGLSRDHTAPARATLEALEPILQDGLSLEDARVLQIADGPFAVVTLRNRARLLVGSALIEGELGLAMARATLDAANRFIKSPVATKDRTIQLT